MTRKNLRLLSYGRVSDVRGREGPAFISPAEQTQRNRSYADAYGHTIVEEGMELDRSGGDMDRPILNGFLDQIERGVADGIIVAKLDRFARSNLGALQAIERIERNNGVLISVAEQIDTSGYAGKFMRSIFVATAQMERDRIGEQWLTARSRAVERGIHVSRHVPPGYDRLAASTDAGKDRRLVPHPVHSKTIKAAYKMAAEGMSAARIADFLTDQGLPSNGQGTHWQSNRVARLLANRVYLGEARSGKGLVNTEAHEPLVDERTWLLAQHRRAASLGHADTLLAGLCRCASCSFAMRSQSGRAGTAVAVYRCPTTTVHGRCSGPSTISQTRLDDYVIEEFLARADAYFVPQEVTDDDTVLAAASAEQTYRDQLANTELRRQIGNEDHDALIATLHREWQDLRAKVTVPAPHIRALEGVSLAALVERLRREENVQDLRELLGSAIAAVFVRSAASRSHSLPIADRVRVVFHGEEPLDLPRRGERYEPRAYVW